MARVYSEDDFVNEKGTVPSFWRTQDENNELITWGPCFPPSATVDWNKTIDVYANKTDYHPIKRESRHSKTFNDLSDFCRPGFIIIGAGKCGTSSLYHYIIGHPRVLPASQKQIHYFKVSQWTSLDNAITSHVLTHVSVAQYYFKYPMKWYLSHFPTATSFLANGALMTGEASPGYLPYPDVAARTARQMSGSKIVAIGREPIDRAWSSYRYNYVNPATDIMKRGEVHGIERGESDDFYTQYLFSFEEMIKAELKVLKECFAPGGPGQVETEKMYGTQSWAVEEFKRREENGLPPLIDLDETCYGKRISKAVPRKQWADLLAANPEKFVDLPHLFLSQALLGRSLYVFPLEWWYITFPKEEIYFMCTEEMRDLSGEPINQLGQFLGLPSYDFSDVVGEGAFNVGGHKGYDKEVSWAEIEKETEEEPTGDDSSSGGEIPLSDEFRKELAEFIRPYNERLFDLVGRRCNW